MSKATFKPDHAGFKAMAVGNEIRAACLEAAEKAKVEARALSADFIRTGDYEASFHVRTADVELRTGWGTHPVAAGILENTSDHAAAVEWGNHKDGKPHHVLRKALGMLNG